MLFGTGVVTSRLQEQDVPRSPALLAHADVRARFPARVVIACWPAAMESREETLGRLTCAPFVSGSAGAEETHTRAEVAAGLAGASSRADRGRSGKRRRRQSRTACQCCSSCVAAAVPA